jgi:hypothetical protein
MTENQTMSKVPVATRLHIGPGSTFLPGEHPTALHFGLSQGS